MLSTAVLAVALAASPDWLVDPVEAIAELTVEGNDLVLDNGLVRRTWRTGDGFAACVAFDDLRTDRSLLRAVRPEARITIDGQTRDVGGLVGQPNHAYLTGAWLDAMTPVIALLMIVALALSSVAPSTPGYVGIYQFVAVSVLTPIGFVKTEALALVLLFQATIYAAVTPWGLIGLWRLGGIGQASVPGPAEAESRG